MFKARFVELLQASNVSAYKLSADTGIPQSLISEWKKGIKSPASENLIKLAAYFDVSVDYLLGRADTPNPPALVIPDALKGARVAFHRGEFEDLTQDEIDRLAEIAVTLKKMRPKESRGDTDDET